MSDLGQKATSADDRARVRFAPDNGHRPLPDRCPLGDEETFEARHFQSITRVARANMIGGI